MAVTPFCVCAFWGGGPQQGGPPHHPLLPSPEEPDEWVSVVKTCPPWGLCVRVSQLLHLRLSPPQPPDLCEPRVPGLPLGESAAS